MKNEINKISNTINRKSELNWILSVIAPNASQRGRISFMDKTFINWLKRTGEIPPDFNQMVSILFLSDPMVMDEGRNNIPTTIQRKWRIKKE